MKNDEMYRTHRLIQTAACWVTNIMAVILLALFVVMGVGAEIQVDGRSMEPTLENQDVVLINKICYDFHNVGRFDVVAFSRKEDSSSLLIKRIVGLPGETVQINDGHIYIDGVQLDTEGYMETAAVAGLAKEPVTLGESEYFVMGDWPEVSEDSRFDSVGNVEQSQILGKVWFVMRPFSRMGFVAD